MKKKLTFTGSLIYVEPRKCSVYGNPKFFGVFQDSEGNIMAGTTASNASCAYGFRDLMRCEAVEVTYHYTAKGSLIIDYTKRV